MAEQKESELKTRVKEKIEGLRARFEKPPRPHDVSGFKSELQNFIRAETHAAATEAVRMVTEGRSVSIEKIKAAVDESIDARSPGWGKKDGGGQSIFKSYGQMNKCVEDALEIRRQEKWADTQDRRQSLVYRMLTTIGIAAVIFLVSLLSHCTGIPLPMLRMV